MHPTTNGSPSSPRMVPFSRPLTLVVLAAVLGTGWLLSWHSLTDIDIWFHLRSGRDLLAGGGMEPFNRYSFTEPEHPWLNHEWLFQVGAAVLGPDTDSGSLQVTAWNVARTVLGLVLTLVLAWSAGLFRRTGGSTPWVGVALLGGLLLLWPRLTLRPELISYTCFILLVHGAESAARAPSRNDLSPWRALLRGPALFCLLVTLFWAQSHGFAAMAPAVLALAALLAPLEKRWMVPRPSGGSSHGSRWLLTGAALVLLAATPNGLAGLLFPFRALGQFSGSDVDLRRTVSELVPLLQSPESLDWTIKAYLGSLFWGAIWIIARWRDLGLLRIVLFALAAVAAWSSQRNIGLYAVTFVLLHGPPSGRTSWLITSLRLSRVPARAVAGAGLTVLALTCLLWWPSIMSDGFYLHEGVARRFGGGVNPARYPVAPVAGLEGAERFFANLDAAAFALAHAPGGIFIDGRTEAYSPDLWGEYLVIKRGGEEALGHLSRRRVDAVCLATGNPAFGGLVQTLWRSDAWSLARADGAGLLFGPVRRNAVAVSDTVIVREAMARVVGEAETGSATRRADLLLAASRLAGMVGDHRAGQEFLTRGLEHRPDHPALHHNLGNLFMIQERFGEAGGHFEAALAVNPRLAGSALNAGVCLSRQGDTEGARGFYRRAVRIDPRHFEAWMNLAVTELARGDSEAARRAANRARELRPRDRGVRELQRRLGS